VEWVSEWADHKTQTCEIRLKQKRLPELAAVSRHLRELGLGASLGGVEATVVGTLEDGTGPLVLELSETGERLPLAPLSHKIQWDPEKQREHPMTRQEQGALARLRGQLGPGSGRFEVVGPLVSQNETLQLEVRSFRRLADDRR
jgi:hypothetical protein